MEDRFSRTRLLLGDHGMDRLKNARVAVFGIGGVGGYTTEALARCGLGALDLIDKDKISPSNLNRQIIATSKTIGQYKTDAMRDRILEIDPSIQVTVYPCFYLPETKDQFDFSQYDYIVDAVDTVTAKIQLALDAKAAGVPIISSMGAGNKLDASAFQVADLYETSVCPLARVMRRELRKRQISHLKVVYSTEEPIQPKAEPEAAGKKPVPGSVAFVPAVAGMIIAGEVVRDLTEA